MKSSKNCLSALYILYAESQLHRTKLAIHVATSDTKFFFTVYTQILRLNTLHIGQHTCVLIKANLAYSSVASSSATSFTYIRVWMCNVALHKPAHLNNSTLLNVKGNLVLKLGKGCQVLVICNYDYVVIYIVIQGPLWSCLHGP